MSKERLSRACLGPGWTELHRIKCVRPFSWYRFALADRKYPREHIKRCHTPEYLKDRSPCLRCHEGFKTNELLAQHLREEQQCLNKSPEIIVGWVTLEQAENLRSTKRKLGMSDEEKWFEMYQILFPSHDLSTMTLTPCKSRRCSLVTLFTPTLPIFFDSVGLDILIAKLTIWH